MQLAGGMVPDGEPLDGEPLDGEPGDGVLEPEPELLTTEFNETLFLYKLDIKLNTSINLV